jgi:hypothetical protein
MKCILTFKEVATKAKLPSTFTATEFMFHGGKVISSILKNYKIQSIHKDRLEIIVDDNSLQKERFNDKEFYMHKTGKFGIFRNVETWYIKFQ